MRILPVGINDPDHAPLSDEAVSRIVARVRSASPKVLRNTVDVDLSADEIRAIAHRARKQTRGIFE